MPGLPGALTTGRPDASADTASMRVNGSLKPQEPGTRSASTGSTLTTPAHSVIPRMLRTGMPSRCSKATASSGGSGDPPVSNARTALRLKPSGSTPSKVDITVGTAASKVTWWRSTTSQYRDTSRALRMPSKVGNTISAPESKVERP